jgi:phosphohistidine phosphatase
MDSQAASPDREQEPSSYELYIMRHGPAGERGPEYPDDSARPLTPAGKKKMADIARGLKRMDLALDWIVTSPLVRAVQTAEIVAALLGSKCPMDPCDDLSPGGSFQGLSVFLARHPERKRVLVVGHEPDLSQLAAGMIGAGRQAQLSFKKGGCCRIDLEGPAAKSAGLLVWWLTPRLLRAMA